MRAVKAKLLRKIVRLTHKGLASIAYHEKQHKPKLLTTGELNEDGTQKKVLFTPITRILQDCQREVYQGLKKLS